MAGFLDFLGGPKPKLWPVSSSSPFLMVATYLFLFGNLWDAESEKDEIAGWVDGPVILP